MSKDSFRHLVSFEKRAPAPERVRPVPAKPAPAEGVWHVVAKAPGYEEERWTLEVTPGKPARLRARLTSSAGADSR